MNDMTDKFVLGFVFDRTNAFVLLQESLYPGFKGKWNGIGGKPLDAMKRESEEETGFVPADGWDYKFRFVCLGGEIYVFKAETSLKRNHRREYVQFRACPLKRHPTWTG